MEGRKESMTLSEFFCCVKDGPFYPPYHPNTLDWWDKDPISIALKEHSMKWEEVMKITGMNEFWERYQKNCLLYTIQDNGTIERTAFDNALDYALDIEFCQVYGS
jgi:hypothetical protein